MKIDLSLSTSTINPDERCPPCPPCTNVLRIKSDEAESKHEQPRETVNPTQMIASINEAGNMQYASEDFSSQICHKHRKYLLGDCDHLGKRQNNRITACEGPKIFSFGICLSKSQKIPPLKAYSAKYN